MQLLDQAGVFSAPEDGRNRHWVEHLRTTDLSVGTYSVPLDGQDEQTPHTEDEIYVVVTGRGTFWTPEQSVAIGPGSVIFVPALEEHRFIELTEPLTVLVVFAPAEGTRE